MPEIVHVRPLAVTVEANGRSSTMSVNVPVDAQPGDAELVITVGGRPRHVTLPFRSLQGASSVHLTFDRSSGVFTAMQVTEIDDDRSISAAIERGLASARPRNAVARRDPVSGELRVTYDEPEGAPAIVVNVEPTPITFAPQINVQENPGDAEIVFKRDPKSGKLVSAKITETEESV